MTIQSITFSQNILDCVIRDLTDLQRLGGSANDDFWLLGESHVNVPKLPASADVLRPELLDALRTMKRIEEMMLTLRKLAQSCERKLRSLKKEIGPSFMHCGIQILPDEVLGYIFELLVHDKEDASFTSPEVALSHVSSRFRAVCLNTQSLWTRLDSRMSISWIKAHLDRSRDSPLTVCIHELLPGSEQLYKLIWSCASRWRSLQTREYVLLLHGLEHPRKRCLPELKYVTIDSDTEVDRYIVEGLEILGKLDKPKLSHVFLDCSRWCQEKINPNRFFSSETIRSFTSYSSQFNAEVSAVLESLPNLSELHLDIKIDGVRRNVTLPKVTLLKVEYFSLIIRVSYNLARQSMPQSMSHLHMPRLAKFQLDINATIYNDECNNWDGEWEGFVPGGGQAISVTDFTLRYNVVELSI